jgi:1-deoxy-D-xylulose-5-phosphate reductoisomerase
VVLGATGSVGRQTLEVAKHLGLQVTGMGARFPSQELLDLALSHPEAALAVAGGSSGDRKEFANSLAGRDVEFGSEALIALAVRPAQTVMNAVVGLAGLPFTLAALEAGNRLALANKESLVAAGPVLQTALSRGGGELIPVDSEHSAILQCLMGEDQGALARLILTASGGPFRGWSREEMEEVTPAQALKHPNWVMGKRITVDSATLVNKAFEVIEANQLFGISFDQIEVVIHPQSVVHSMVEFSDGSTKAHLGYPDMRIPIAFALTYPVRRPGLVDGFRWPGQSLTFEDVDLEAFPALALGFAAGRQGGSAPTVFNATDEIAVEAFLDGRIGFNGISRVISDALETVPHSNPSNLEEVIEVDRDARATAASLIAGAC